MTTVERPDISLFIILFVFYILTHIGIGVLLNKHKKQMETDTSEQTLKMVATLSTLFKWYPAIYVVVTLIILGA